jgi:hypothetical protein
MIYPADPGRQPRMGNTEVMTPAIRRVFAFLSACGIAACVLAYIYSFFAGQVDTILPWWVLLILVGMALVAPIYALEYPSSRAPSFSWKGFARGMPSWVAPCFWVLSLIAIAHFVWSAAQDGLGVPAIVDGQYVLDNHGRILKVLTQAEYLTLKAAELRALATMMISVYFVPLVYWWFRRSHHEETG